MAIEEALWNRQVGLDTMAGLASPHIEGDIKILQYPLVRGDGAWESNASLGWVEHMRVGSWKDPNTDWGATDR